MSSAGYVCEFCGGQHPVRYLFTSLANGETLVMCAEDTPVALIPMLAAHLGVDYERLYDSIKRFVDREAAREAKLAAEAPGPEVVTDPGAEGDGTDPEGEASPADPGTDPADMTNAEYYGAGAQ